MATYTYTRGAHPREVTKRQVTRNIYLSHGRATSMPNCSTQGLQHQGLKALSYKDNRPFSTGCTAPAATRDKMEVQAPCPAAGRGCPTPLAVWRMSTGLGYMDRWLEKCLTSLPRGRQPWDVPWVTWNVGGKSSRPRGLTAGTSSCSLGKDLRLPLWDQSACKCNVPIILN